MPGDPKREKYIVDTYLKNAVLVNDIRGVQGYTGEYKGKKVSVMASGMVSHLLEFILMNYSMPTMWIIS